MSEPRYVVDVATGCWEWAGYRNEKGYGIRSVDGRTRRAHVVAYEAAHGRVPAGLEVDHECRNRACVNPAHLRAVTHTENVRRKSSMRLRPDQVEAIRAEYAAGGISQNALGAKYGVSHTTVGHIIRGVTWRPIPERTAA